MKQFRWRSGTVAYILKSRHPILLSYGREIFVKRHDWENFGYYVVDVSGRQIMLVDDWRKVQELFMQLSGLDAWHKHSRRANHNG